ncbi:MAG: type II toxin-antitoxin system HicB family antitoxin [Halobacteriales archaeon]|nr:type II toxin-antitoxin system HicB family antitoxin [Halobacteriales archaeon]
MEFLVVLEQDESGWIIADVPQLPGCHTQGKDKQEALANIREAIELYLQDEDVVPSKLFGVEYIQVPA